MHSGHYADLDLSRYRSAASKIRVVSADTRSVVPLSRLNRAYKPNGHYWRALDVLEFYHTLHVALDKPMLATELQLSLGAREGYEIHVNGERVAVIERVGDYHVLRNHTVALPGPVLA